MIKKRRSNFWKLISLLIIHLNIIKNQKVTKKKTVSKLLLINMDLIGKCTLNIDV